MGENDTPQDDVKALQSSMDKQIAEVKKELEGTKATLAEKDKRIAELEVGATIQDDHGLEQERKTFVEEQAKAKTESDERDKAYSEKVLIWERDRISKEFKIPLEDLAELNDPVQMENLALKRQLGEKSDRPGSHTDDVKTNRLDDGIAQALKKIRKE